MRVAFFLDFDGTVAKIVDDPRAVSVSGGMIRTLERLREATGGALAVISGREIADLDRFLAPLSLPAAGVHGAEHRGGDGSLRRTAVAGDALERAAGDLDALAALHEGLLVERKWASVALHYRARPDLAATTLAAAEGIARDAGGELVRGKMVAEIKLTARTKADAIRDFMDEAPFAGRLPVFAGDDRTDEDGFAALRDWRGVSIKIGDGETLANYRMADVDAFERWLAGAADGWERAA
ncbi:MAG: trehalose-phosphatase [Flavobacteriaceae bacterium]